MLTVLYVLMGVAIGWVIAYCFLEYLYFELFKQQYDENNQKLDEQSAKHNAVIYKLAKRRIDEVNDIIDEQLGLWSQFDMPNTSASHSKWKRDLIAQNKELEEEKMDIFREILEYGIDLNIEIASTDGTSKKQLISEIVSDFDSQQPPMIKNDPIKTNERKLVLVRTSDDEQST